MTVITSVLAAVVIFAVPAVFVIAALVVLGSIVSGLADGLPNGLVRPNPS